MNYRMSAYLLGEILLIVAGLMLVPFAMAFAFGEQGTPLSFGITIASTVVLALPWVLKKPKKTDLKARGGFIVVGLAWILLSLLGAMPFAIGGYASYLDALFETVSGFTTTGATVFAQVENLPKSLLFWRSFTHWIGGMGVLIFVIAVLPKSDAAIVHLAKAETAGPQFGKLVSKLRFTARILYAIYIVLTLIETVALILCGMDVFDAFTTAFATAGTGGFSCRNSSIAFYDSVAVEIVVMVFMFLFSVNMNLFFLIAVGKIKDVFRNEELWWLCSYMLLATVILTVSLTVNKVYDTFGQTLRYAAFQVVSIGSSTGFSTADFTTWPLLCQVVLFVCMFIGGMAGSTAGGLKVSRIMILTKSSFRSIRKAVSPRSVISVKIDKKSVDETLVKNVSAYFGLFMLLTFASFILVSVLEKGLDFTGAITSVVTCINNVGPGFSAVIGPAGSFGGLSVPTKIVLIFDMLLGRLEIYPVLLLFSAKAWKR